MGLSLERTEPCVLYWCLQQVLYHGAWAWLGCPVGAHRVRWANRYCRAMFAGFCSWCIHAKPSFDALSWGASRSLSQSVCRATFAGIVGSWCIWWAWLRCAVTVYCVRCNDWRYWAAFASYFSFDCHSFFCILQFSFGVAGSPSSCIVFKALDFGILFWLIYSLQWVFWVT